MCWPYGGGPTRHRTARAGEGPTLLECLTYRFRGHSLADPDELRSEQEKQFWPSAILKALERDLAEQGCPER